MRLLYSLLLVLCTFQVHASSWEDKLRATLPAPLNAAIIGKSTIKELESRMGKPHLVEGSKRYWIKDGLKYAVVLTFKNNKLSTIHYTFTSNKPSVDIIYADISKKSFEPYNTTYFIHRSASTEVVIDPNSKTIYSVRIK